MSSTIWFCPDCYSVVPMGAACECAGSYRNTRHVVLGAPNEIPVMIGHLTLLDNTPRPWRLLEGMCDGPRRYPDQATAESRCACWQRQGGAIWMWQERLEDLPLAGSLPRDDETPSAMALLRAMAATSLLLIEAPQQTPLFRAHYARNKRVFAGMQSFGEEVVTIAQAPPECFEIIDRLQWSFSLSTARRQVIALLDPGRETGEEERLRLADLSATFSVFENREQALRWLLEQAQGIFEHPMPLLYQRLLAVEAAKEAAKKAAAEKSSSTGSRERRTSLYLDTATEPDAHDKSKKSKKTRKETRPPDLVCVADVGGSVGRHLLARLHLQTWAAAKEKEAEEEKESFADFLDYVLTLWPWKQAEEPGKQAEEKKESGPVGLAGNHWWGTGLWTIPAAEGLHYGRVHQLRKGEPPPRSHAPSWSGYAAQWWSKQQFTIGLEEDMLAGGGPVIIGVGPLRTFGERELARLMEWLWQSQRFPAAIIRHERADKDLLRWVRNEFPQTPEFSDSWKGGMRALETALRLARQRALV